MKIEYGTIRISTSEGCSEQERAYLDALLSLSRAWAEEGICPSYGANEADEYVDKEIRAAFAYGRMIGYAMGHFKELEEATSYNKVGERAFELDELYVLPEYRSQGVGKALMRLTEDGVRDRADLIGLIAASERYGELLKFYIDELGMTFNHALLVKRITDL